MFFLLSKLVWFCFQPSTLIGLAGLVGVVLLGRGRLVAGRRWMCGAVLAYWIGGLSPLSDVLIAPLEARFPRPDLSSLNDRVDGIIVLGGAEDGRVNAVRELMSLGDAAERVTEAVALARRFPQAKLVYSGGSDAIVLSKRPEARQALQLFTALGIDRARVIIEETSRNTHENATFTKALVTPKSGERWLLVTSSWHMPRSIGIFRQADFDVIPWPVDYRTPVGMALLMPQSSMSVGLHRLDFITREYVGLLVYWVTGRSQGLFPGP
jgi:uncharacterized SAM-binding protein YcdF (DUF218 family)